MAYNNVKVKARQTVMQSNTQSKNLGIVSVVPMDEWNATTQYQKLNKVRYVSTGGSGVTLLAKKQNQGIEPFISQGWQDIWMVENYDGGSVIPNGTYPDMTVGNATNAQNDGVGENIAEQFADINEKIPSTASAENQLADKAFVNSTVNNMSAFYITYTQGSATEMGQAFPTQESLLNATTFYSGTQVRVPTQNDYATVLADETQPKGADGSYPTTRYVYQTNEVGGTYPNGQWAFQYVVNNTSLTQAQVNAINSGITKEIVDSIGKGTVTGVKGNAETAYRIGNVNLTPANVGAVATTVRVEGIPFGSSADITHFATCSISSTTAAKTVTLTGFMLAAGARIIVKFTYANIVNSPTLNVNETGAKSIKADGDITYVKWIAGSVMEFVYDGIYWVCMAGYQLAGMRKGALYFSNDPTSPATLYGGSWTPIQDRFIVGAGNSYAAGLTGGTREHNHSAGTLFAELSIRDGNHVDINSSGGGITWTATNEVGILRQSPTTIQHGDGVVIAGNTGTASNDPPYLAEYMWYRTA